VTTDNVVARDAICQCSYKLFVLQSYQSLVTEHNLLKCVAIVTLEESMLYYLWLKADTELIATKLISKISYDLRYDTG
jgi:hypothetical protein